MTPARIFISYAVAELMARSGGFNVPADYFGAPRAREPQPIVPIPRRLRWKMLVGGVTALMLAFAVIYTSTFSGIISGALLALLLMLLGIVTYMLVQGRPKMDRDPG